ncbi:MAG: DUF1810 domain-containing protein [Ignavibacteria bacterium]
MGAGGHEARDGDPFDLRRFVDAQNPVYGEVLTELRAGRKRSHWIWFVFPQLAGLGHSAMAVRYAIGSLEEARAYLAHPILRERLLQCTGLLLARDDRTAEDIFGSLDAMKFRSSMTLFARAAPAFPAFAAALDKYFAGQPDPLTLAKLNPAPIG